MVTVSFREELSSAVRDLLSLTWPKDMQTLKTCSILMAKCAATMAKHNVNIALLCQIHSEGYQVNEEQDLSSTIDIKSYQTILSMTTGQCLVQTKDRLRSRSSWRKWFNEEVTGYRISLVAGGEPAASPATSLGNRTLWIKRGAIFLLCTVKISGSTLLHRHWGPDLR